MAIWVFFYVNIFVLGFINMIFLTDRNLLTFLMSCEVSYFSLSLGFVMHSLDTNASNGLIYGVFILVAAVSESVVGLGLISYLTKFRGSIEFNKLDSMGNSN